MADQAGIHQRFQFMPDFHEIGMDIRTGVGTAAADVALRGMIVGERPVDEIEIDIVEPKLAKASLERSQRLIVAVVAIAELGGDE